MLAAMPRPRQARSVETRARLLRAAAEIIAEQGIERASVDAIAERAERTSGSLYGQFGSKDGLIVELLDASKDVVAEAMFADIEAATSLDERLAALWRNFASPPAAARDWVQFEHEMWVWANRPGNAGARARLAERYRAEFATLATALDEWTEEGLIAPLDSAQAAATTVVGTLLGLEMIYRLDPAALDESSVVATLRGVLRSHEVGGADADPGHRPARPDVARRDAGRSDTARPSRRPRGARPALAAVPDPAPVGE
jgi:AcrR family transcriptional regulator